MTHGANFADRVLKYPPGTSDLQERTVRGGRFQLTLSKVMTGDLKLKAEATIGEETRSDETGNVQIVGRNPTRQEVQAELGSDFLRRLACHESRQKQFAANPGEAAKCPLFSADRLGGVGIMQVTTEPSFEDYFDWRSNIRHGKEIFEGKRQYVDDYPTNIKGPTFASWVETYNTQCRDGHRPRLPRLRSVVVPALPSGGVGNPREYERDWLRMYNGACGPPHINGPLHEYKLVQDPVCQLQLDVDEVTLVGTAKWERVDPAVRCGICPAGSENYAADVLSFNPASCAQGTPEIPNPRCR